MKKFLQTKIIVAALALMSASAATAQDSTYVHFDFNANPWGLPTCGISGWSRLDYEPSTAILSKATELTWDVNGKNLTVTVYPSDLDETDYENAMAKGENYDNGATETFLYTFTGSYLKFTAPEGMSMAKAAFSTYRRWSNGSLYSSELTDGLHVWGPDSAKTKTVTVAGTEYVYDCWSGDSVEWQLPLCTGQTIFRYIDFWLLPLDRSGITEMKMDDDELVDVVAPNGVVMRRNAERSAATADLPKGIYIVDKKKVVVR